MSYGSASYGSMVYGSLSHKGTPSALSFPDNTSFQALRFGRTSNTQTFRSPLTDSVQTAELTGGRWIGTFKVKPLTRSQAQSWIVFLLKLKGQAGRFFAHDPSNALPQGTVAGSNPIVNGVNQVGASIKTSGWAASTSSVLKQGDAIAFDTATNWRERHIVAEDVDSDSSGNAVIRLTHSMRETPLNGEQIITTRASCIMKLIDDDQAMWSVDNAIIFGIEFSGEEIPRKSG